MNITSRTVLCIYNLCIRASLSCVVKNMLPRRKYNLNRKEMFKRRFPLLVYILVKNNQYKLILSLFFNSIKLLIKSCFLIENLSLLCKKQINHRTAIILTKRASASIWIRFPHAKNIVCQDWLQAAVIG